MPSEFSIRQENDAVSQISWHTLVGFLNCSAMKTLKLTLCLTLSLVLSVQVHGDIGTMTCGKKGLVADAKMEQTMGVKCPLDIESVPMDFAPSPDMSIESIMKSLGPAFGGHYKCMFTILKAVDDKTGKINVKAAAHYTASFKPAECQNKMKPKFDACIKKHNPEIKKEVGSKGKSWAGFSLCVMDAMEKICPPQ